MRYSVSFDESADDVPMVMRGAVAEECDENGRTTVHDVWIWGGRVWDTAWEYEGDVTLPTVTETVRDATYGNVLEKTTYETEGWSVVGSETSTYDDKNRLRSTQYADGTELTNAYSCCRLLWSRDRLGRKTLRSAVTGRDRLYWADEDVYLADVQTNGHRVTQHFCDELGRETNTVVYVASVPGEATDGGASAGKVLRRTVTSYPNGGDDCTDTTDERGKRTVEQTVAYADREQRETCVYDGAGTLSVRTERTDWRNGDTVTKTSWDGKWKREREITGYDAAGCRFECRVTESSDGGTVTNAVTRYDFLGRVVTSERPDGVTTYTYAGSTGRRAASVTQAGGIVRTSTAVHDAYGNEVGSITDGIVSRTDTAYETGEEYEVWKVTRSIVATADGSTTNSVEVTRVRMTGLGGVDGVREERVMIAADGVVTRSVRKADPSGLEGAEVTSVSNDTGVATMRISRYGMVVESTTPFETRRYAYDAQGQAVAEAKVVNGETVALVETAYTAAGDVAGTSVITNGAVAAEETYAYDVFGRRVSVANALGDVTTTAYDAMGKAVGVAEATWPVRAEYDTAGRRISMKTTRDGTDWDETRWTYDPRTGRCTSKTYADNRGEVYTYAADGLPVRETRASGKWRERVYDAQRHLAGIASSDGSADASFAYDAFGRQVAATGGVFGVLHALSRNGLATNECVSVGGQVQDWMRSTDGFGRVAGRGASGCVWQTVAYDAAGRISGVATPEVAVTYVYGEDGSDSGAEIAIAGGVTVRRQVVRDAWRGLALGVSNAVAGSCLKGYACAYDAAGRLVARNGEGYSYNIRGELTGETEAVTNRAYAYDTIGNFTAVGGASLSANAVNQYAGLVYDADGCLTGAEGKAFAYDAAGRLVSVSTGGVCVASYAYDCFDRRVMKTTGGATHRYFYDGWNLVRERIDRADGTGETVEYFWGKDASGSLEGAGGVGGLVYVRKGGLAYVPLYDQNGNVVGYVNGGGALVAEYAYDGFGNCVASAGSMADAFRFRFSTKYEDPETGFLYYGYRYLVPLLGRWLTRDPIGEQGGANLYAFCGNDGVNRCDKLGEYVFINDVNDVPAIMNRMGWGTAAALLGRWFRNRADAKIPPDTWTVKMDWILGYPRARKSYDEIFRKRLYKTPNAIKEIKRTVIQRRFGTAGRFCNLGRRVLAVDKDYVQHNGVDSTYDIDELTAALGGFSFRIAVSGVVHGGCFTADQVGVYAHDELNFIDRGWEKYFSQPLGFWNSRTMEGGLVLGSSLDNADFVDYQKRTGWGCDYEIYSDVKVVPLYEKFTVKLR